MNIGDEVIGIRGKYKGVKGYLLGDGFCEDFMYIRTEDDLLSKSPDYINCNFKVTKEADTSKPVKTGCMFG